MGMSFDDRHLVKLKLSKVPDAHIAAKFGITKEALEIRWQRVQREIRDAAQGSFAQLVDQFTVMAHQYQLLGESMKIVAGAIGDTMPSEEIRALIGENDEETLRNLKTKAIVLRPFTAPISPEESIRKTAVGN